MYYPIIKHHLLVWTQEQYLSSVHLPIYRHRLQHGQWIHNHLRLLIPAVSELLLLYILFLFFLNTIACEIIFDYLSSNTSISMQTYTSILSQSIDLYSNSVLYQYILPYIANNVLCFIPLYSSSCPTLRRMVCLEMRMNKLWLISSMILPSPTSAETTNTEIS